MRATQSRAAAASRALHLARRAARRDVVAFSGACQGRTSRGGGEELCLRVVLGAAAGGADSKDPCRLFRIIRQGAPLRAFR